MLNKKLLGSVSSPPSDDNFENVSLLLNGDGTNGAQNNTFLDSSTNNFTITRNGNTTQGSFSPYGNLWSNYFNSGNSSYLSVPDSSALELGTNSFTMEAWVFPTSFASTSALFSKMTSSGAASGFLLQAASSTGVMSFYASSNGSSWDIVSGIGSTSLNLNSWNHIAVGRSGSSFRIWINGTSSGTATSSGSVENNSASVLVGAAGQSSTTNFANSYISNARIVNGTDVYGVSNSTITVPTTPLTAVTNTALLTCQSNRFIDNSSNNFTLTPNGSPSVQRFSPFNPTAPYSTSVIGGSGYFDGSDWLALPSGSAFQFGTGDFTVELWAYYTATVDSDYLIDARNSSQTGAWAFANGLTNTGDISWFNGSTVLSSSVANAPKQNTWNHLVYVRSGTTGSIFVNGSRVATTTDSTNYSVSPTTSYIGVRYSTDSPNFFSGYMASMRVVKGSAVYDPTSSTLTVPTAPLTAITNTQLLTNFTNAGIPDLAMQNNLETVGNAQVSTSVKKYGTGSLAFDGTGDYLQIVNNNIFDTNGTFTLECWVYQNSSGDGCFFGRGGGDGSWSASNGHQFLLFISGGTLYWMWNTGGGGNTSISTSAPASGQWHHLAVGYNGTTTRFWLNGTSLGTSTTGYTMPTTRNIIRVGLNPSNESPLNGYIDDLRFTKGIDRYGVGNSTITPPASALPSF